ncbi:thermonuclease family protein [Leptolyngbya sp. GB1-A1]|uniref:thermonuclease family protein n=1 Tax=Leptolyngbya sp. GB1-A1 TaxID=2933908 RepID=UPI003297784C
MNKIGGMIGSVGLGISLLAVASLHAVFAFISMTKQLSANRPDYDSGNPSPRTSLAPEPKQSERGQVVSVSDGDTLVVRSGGREQRVRFCGIDAPEKDQPLGSEAKAYLQKLVDDAGGNGILMQIDRDKDGQMVAEVFTRASDGSEKSLQEELLMAGLAYVYPTYVSSCPNGNSFKQAEAIAKEKRVGVWGRNDQRPWDYRKANR